MSLVEGASRVSCGVCSSILDEPLGLAQQERAPCSSCGSLQRGFEMEQAVGVELRASRKLRKRAQGLGPWVVEDFEGADLWRRAQRWMHKVRRIDRETDRYLEIVTDPRTGEIVHHTDEPLSEHHRH